MAEVSGECLAHLLPVLVDLLVAEACPLGASVKLFVALVCQFACTAVSKLLRHFADSLNGSVSLSQVLKLLSTQADAVADAEGVCRAVLLRGAGLSEYCKGCRSDDK